VLSELDLGTACFENEHATRFARSFVTVVPSRDHTP
jgi:hypothetical protein